MIENSHICTELPCPLVQGTIHSELQLLSGGIATDGHILMLYVPPHRLDQVQFGTIRRQVEQPDARRLQSTQLLPNVLAVMRGVVVQHHHTWPASLVPRRHLPQRSGHLAHLCPDEI